MFRVYVHKGEQVSVLRLSHDNDTNITVQDLLTRLPKDILPSSPSNLEPVISASPNVNQHKSFFHPFANVFKVIEDRADVFLHFINPPTTPNNPEKVKPAPAMQNENNNAPSQPVQVTPAPAVAPTAKAPSPKPAPASPAAKAAKSTTVTVKKTVSPKSSSSRVPDSTIEIAAALSGASNVPMKLTISTDALKKEVLMNAEPSSSSQVDQFFKLAEGFEAKRNMLKAKEIYMSLFNLNSQNPHVCKKLGQLFLKAERYSEAAQFFSRAHNLVDSDVDVCYGYGQALFHCEKYDQAAERFDDALTLLFGSASPVLKDSQSKSGRVRRSKSKPSGRSAGSRYDCAKALKWISVITSTVSNSSDGARKHLDILVWLVKALYKIGPTEQQVGIKILESFLKVEENHSDALLNYAIAAIDRDQVHGAIPILLRALVGNPGTEVKEVLAKVVTRPNGVKDVVEQLNTAKTSPEALAYLALCVRECGAVNAAIRLYSLATKYLDTSANLYLILMHTQELACRFQDCMDTAKLALRKVGISRLGALELRKIGDILEKIGDINSNNAKNGTIPGIQFEECMELFDQGKHHDVYNRFTPKRDPSPDVDPSNATIFSASELDVLALLETVVKILFVCGVLQPLPALINLIEPLRKDQKLHRTGIRNENAYFGCCGHLMRIVPYPLNLNLKPIYCVGDSHCLSLGWQKLSLNGEDRLLVPKLVTGLKCWHLRPKSSFFPKKNFEYVMKSIPNNSSAIFIFGEIDCREALPLVVERCKYDTLEEAIDVTVGIYLAALEKIKRTKNLEIFLHPVPPVLDYTRQFVQKFNASLKSKVKECSSFVYLDFYEDLLTSDGYFNLDYALDGTHMHPSYIPLLEKALRTNVGAVKKCSKPDDVKDVHC
jgi:tetratricopeptide (TPR) repeat protein